MLYGTMFGGSKGRSTGQDKNLGYDSYNTVTVDPT